MNATFRERLPSAAAAIGLQVGLFALLAVSFNVVRHIGEEKETILELPALGLPQRPAPLTIDARGRTKKPSATVPMSGGGSGPAFTAPPAGAVPSLEGTTVQPAPITPDCVPLGQARPASRPACPPPPRPAQTDEIPLHPESHVKDQAHWAEQWEREHAEYLPGVTASERSIQVELFNSAGPSLLGGDRTPVADPTHPHASDADFGKAMDAYHERMRTLYPRQPAGTAHCCKAPPSAKNCPAPP